MIVNHYIGFDVHKKSISYCVKTADGKIVEEGNLRATHQVLGEWAQKRTEPWHGAMEATLFSSWMINGMARAKPFDLLANRPKGRPSRISAALPSNECALIARRAAPQFLPDSQFGNTRSQCAVR